MEDIIKLRTNQQNKAWHVYEKELSQAMYNHGVDMRTFLKEGVEIPPTKAIVHDHITLPLVKSMFGKTSTKDLEVHEVDKLYEVINKHIREKLGLNIPFPCADNFITNEEYEKIMNPKDTLHPWRK